jgi:GTP 3',8-cyclase
MGSPLIDAFGRQHNNLRISVTDRCNLRCTYCMPEDVTFLDKNELLSFEEIVDFVRVIAPLGVDKVRLTGGEPLLRRDLHQLVRNLLNISGIQNVGVTTNGLLLAAQARALYDAGLRRLNVSLDTLDPGRFRLLARRDGLEQVLEGLTVARDIGFQQIKVNAVIIRGVNDVDIAPLGRAAREHDWELRFIECMPIGAETWERHKAILAHQIIEVLEREIGPLRPADDYDPHSPSMDFEFADGFGRVGFIASISRPFCRNCNRLRLTAEGKIRNCLFALDEIDVKPFLRPAVNATALVEAVRANVADKWEGHEINTSRFIKPARTMHAIGG